MQFVNEQREHTHDVADMGPGHYVTRRWNQTCAILEQSEIEQYTSKANDIALIGRQFENTIRSTIDAYKDQVKKQAQIDHSQTSKNLFFKHDATQYANLCCSEFEIHVERHLKCFNMHGVYQKLADGLNVPYYVPEVKRKMDLEDVDYLDRRFNDLSNVFVRIEELFDHIHQTFTPTKPEDIKRRNMITSSVIVFVSGLLITMVLDVTQII